MARIEGLKCVTVSTLQALLAQLPADALLSAQTLAGTGNLAVFQAETMEQLGYIDMAQETYEAFQDAD